MEATHMSETLDFFVPAGTGLIIELDEAGVLPRVEADWNKYWRLRSKLSNIDQRRMRLCNDFAKLSRLRSECQRRGKPFSARLRRLVNSIDSHREKILQSCTKLQERMALAAPCFERIFKSLAKIPISNVLPDKQFTSTSNDTIFKRRSIIQRNLNKSSLLICKMLDSENISIPEPWEKSAQLKEWVSAYKIPRYRNRIQKLICLEKRNSRLPLLPGF
jgi:hypothetical protein